MSRILLPAGIGIVQFYQSIINYIILFSSLGIPLYAVREISKYRDDEKERNKVTLEILLLHGILSCLGYLVVFILIINVRRIADDWPLFLILSLSIFLNVIGVNWFYQAIEDFKFITIRSLIVRIISLIALFIFVRSKNDLYAYAIILVGGQVGNYLFNFIRLRRYLNHFSVFNVELKLKHHLQAAFKIFILNVAISLYINLNPVMLGFMSNDTYVGYYTSVTRIISAINGITTALGMAILPRLSNYFATEKFEEYNSLKTKALNVITFICCPVSIAILLMASNIIPIFSGNAYLPAVQTLKISAPTLCISAFNYIIAIQILYTQNKEKIVILSTLLGGILNIIMNLILIPHLYQNGTAISGLCAELAVLGTCLLCGKKYLNYNFLNKNNGQVLLASIMSYLFCLPLSFLPYSNFVILVIEALTFLIVYTSILSLQKNDIFMEYIHIISQKTKTIRRHSSKRPTTD